MVIQYINLFITALCCTIFSNQQCLVKETMMLLTSMEHWPKKAGNSTTTSVCSRFSQAWYLGRAHCLLPGISDSKESTCNVGDQGSIPGLRRSPGGGYGNPLQYSCLENRHGQRSLAGYRPWGHEESDRTEGLSASRSSLQVALLRIAESSAVALASTYSTPVVLSRQDN